jgi:hypothetical protein
MSGLKIDNPTRTVVLQFLSEEKKLIFKRLRRHIRHTFSVTIIQAAQFANNNQHFDAVNSAREKKKIFAKTIGSSSTS